MAEVGSTEDRIEKAKTRALNSYNSAIQIANELSPADPVRLSLYLNFSVYYYDIYGGKKGKPESKQAKKEQRE